MSNGGDNNLKDEQNEDKSVSKYKKKKTNNVIVFPDNLVKKKISNETNTNSQSVDDINNSRGVQR